MFRYADPDIIIYTVLQITVQITERLDYCTTVAFDKFKYTVIHKQIRLLYCKH
jgi:hypothetical protein